MINRAPKRWLTRDRYGIAINTEPNSCIFFTGWKNSDIDKLEFTNKIYGENDGFLADDNLICRFCGRDLDLAYVFIIYQLREAGLLPEDYVSMCCFCNVLACIGFWIPPEWTELSVRESGLTIINGTILLISAWDQNIKENIDLTLRIYDIKLTLKTGRVFDDVGVY